MNISKKEQRIVFITIAFVLLTGYPFLKIFNIDKIVLGMPMLYTYLFFIWLLYIVVIAIMINSKKK
jgi:hypothetical protein